MVEAGSGNNKLTVDQTASSIALNTKVTSDVISSELLPGVNYVSTEGKFAGGVSVHTGEFSDSVQVINTLPVITTSVDTHGGNDSIVVSSTGDSNGHLSLIRGPLNLETGNGVNSIQASDRSSTNSSEEALIFSIQLRWIPA